MPKQYSEKAIAECRKFYCDFGGNGSEIEKAMRKAGYPNWQKQLLYDKGSKGPNARLGWVTKFGFEKSLELHQQAKIGSVTNDDERAYKTIVELADQYRNAAINGDDKAADRYAKFIQLQLELRNKLDLSQSNFESFVEDFELIADWAKDIDPDLAKLFYKRKEQFIDRAAQHYGEAIDG